MQSALIVAGTVRGEEESAAAVERAVEGLPEAVDEVVVSCRPGQGASVGQALDDGDYRLAVEPGRAYTPLAALRTGFRIATGSAVAVVDARRQRFDRALLAALFDAVDTAAVPRGDGCLYPLHAVYERFAGRRAAERTLATGSDRLYDLLSEVDPVVVDADAVCETTSPLATPDAHATGTVVSGDPRR